MYQENVSALQVVVHRKRDTFGEWAVRQINSLFLPKREPNYSLIAIVHFFMKRLRQPYSEIMRMDEETRTEIWDIEQAIIEEEIKRNEKNPQ